MCQQQAPVAAAVSILMAYFKQQLSSSSSSYDDNITVNLVNKRIKMDDNKATETSTPGCGSLQCAAGTDENDVRNSHVAVHVSKSDNSRSPQSRNVAGSKASVGSQILNADSCASHLTFQNADAAARLRQKKKPVTKISDVTSREVSQRNSTTSLEDAQRAERIKFSQPEKVNSRLCNENASVSAPMANVSIYHQLPNALIANSTSGFRSQLFNSSGSNINNNINMDLGVEMDLPSPPNEESQQSESRSPSGAGMDETFSEAPHPTPGPIQDTDMDCADAEETFPSASSTQKSLLSSALALVRDGGSNRSRTSSPLTLNGVGGSHDSQNHLLKVLSHDSQWMLQYLQPFNTDSCSSTCTDGNEYYMPENVRSLLTMIARIGDDDRNTFLDHLVWSSPMRQLHHVKALLDPIFTRDFIGALPRDVSLHVLSYLDPVDLGRCARISRSWRIICEDNLLWQVKCHESGYHVDVFNGMRVPMRSLTAVGPPVVQAGAIRINRPSSVSESHSAGLPDDLGYAYKVRIYCGFFVDLHCTKIFSIDSVNYFANFCRHLVARPVAEIVIVATVAPFNNKPLFSIITNMVRHTSRCIRVGSKHIVIIPKRSETGARDSIFSHSSYTIMDGTLSLRW